MVVVKERRPGPLKRRLMAFVKLFRDLPFVIAVIIIVSGVLLFQLSSLSANNVLQHLRTGGGTYDAMQGQNFTVYFSTPHSEWSHLIFSLSSGTVLKYTIFKYNLVETMYGTQYFQFKVDEGTVNSTYNSVYLPVTYIDATYYANVTILHGPSQTVSVKAYAEFYLYQPFQYPAEISGVVITVAGLIMMSVRLTQKFSSK